MKELNFQCPIVLHFMVPVKAREGKPVAKVNAHSLLSPHPSLWSLGPRKASCLHTTLRSKARGRDGGAPWEHSLADLASHCQMHLITNFSQKHTLQRCSHLPFLGGRSPLAECSWKDAYFALFRGKLFGNSDQWHLPLGL